ncbi:MAG: hypothetical protein OH316_00335 [Candidatus Parvarchaeota archaeon]|nr:hypothetical protein [Candidatus Parvarchaeota archaeon]
MMNILLDTNFLIYTFDRKIDLSEFLNTPLSSPYKLFCIDKNIEELNRLGRRDVIGLVDHLKVEILKTGHSHLHVDDLMIKVAKEGGFCIATQDRELIQKSMDAGVPVILRGNKNKARVII